MKHTDSQDLNLQQFHQLHVSPMLRCLESTRNAGLHRTRWRYFAKAALFEAVGWSSLAAVVGHLDEKAPSAVANGIAVNAHNWFDVLDEWGFLFDRQWLDYFHGMGSGPLKLKHDEGLIHSAEVFEACLWRCQRFMYSSSAAASTAAMSFARGDELDHLKPSPINLDQLGDALASDTGSIECEESNETVVLAGFGRTLDFLATITDLRRHYESKDAQMMLRKIVQLLRWRIFAMEHRSSYYTTLLNQYLDSLQVEDAELRKQFVGYASSLIQDWHGMQNPGAAAAGSP